jgi:hypothetical protein
MLKTEARDLIKKYINPIAKKNDMKWSSKYHGWIRKTDTGRQSIILGLSDYNPRYVFSIVMTNRIDAVVGILLPFIVSDTPEFISTSMTPMGYFTGKLNSEFSFETESDLESIKPSLDNILNLMFTLLDSNRIASHLYHCMRHKKSEYDIPFDFSAEPGKSFNHCIMAYLYDSEKFEKCLR